MIYQNRFQKKYFENDSKGKIEMILANYVSFQHQLTGIENGIKMDIKFDQDNKMMQERGDLGIKVMTSGISDPTSREAIRNAEIDKAFEDNDFECELERTCTPDIYRNQLEMLRSMKEDYRIVQMVISTLSYKDVDSLKEYFSCQKQHTALIDVAEEKNILASSIYQKIWRVKCKVKSNAIDKFNRKYSRRA